MRAYLVPRSWSWISPQCRDARTSVCSRNVLHSRSFSCQSMAVLGRLVQLRRDPHLSPGAEHRALEPRRPTNVRARDLFKDLLECLNGMTEVREITLSRADAATGRDQFFGSLPSAKYSCEDAERWPAAHGERSDVRTRRAPSSPPPQNVSDVAPCERADDRDPHHRERAQIKDPQGPGPPGGASPRACHRGVQRLQRGLAPSLAVR